MHESARKGIVGPCGMSQKSAVVGVDGTPVPKVTSHLMGPEPDEINNMFRVYSKSPNCKTHTTEHPKQFVVY